MTLEEFKEINVKIERACICKVSTQTYIKDLKRLNELIYGEAEVFVEVKNKTGDCYQIEPTLKVERVHLPQGEKEIIKNALIQYEQILQQEITYEEDKINKYLDEAMAKWEGLKK